ncbi:MAG: ABC transporter permease [Nitrospirota bacterium]
MRKYTHKVQKNLEFGLRSLLRHKMRAGLSLLGIIFGVMAVQTMVSVGEGAKRQSLRQIEQLGTRNIVLRTIPLTEFQEIKARENRSQGLSLYDAERLSKGISRIQDIANLTEIKASVLALPEDIMPLIVTCSPNYFLIQNLHIAEGRFIVSQDIWNKNRICVLGENVQKNLGQQGKVGNFIRIENELFRIVGVLKRVDSTEAKPTVIAAREYNNMIFLPSGVWNLGGNKIRASYDRITEIVIQMKSAEDVNNSIDFIKRVIEINHGGVDDYQIIVPLELLKQSQRTQTTFNIIMGSIASISLLVGGIGIMNIMLANVSERTKEIGIRRSLGATQHDIIMQFLAETVILTFTGGVVGIVIGFIGVWVISAIAGWNTAITFFSIALPLLMSILTGIFSGIYPAHIASKMDPIAALRHV